MEGYERKKKKVVGKRVGGNIIDGRQRRKKRHELKGSCIGIRKIRVRKKCKDEEGGK